MKGIREVAGATKKFCKKDGYGYIVQITFDPETKEIWYNKLAPSVTEVRYGEPVVSFNTSVPMTMKEIEKIINDEIAEREKRKSDRRLESEEPEL